MQTMDMARANLSLEYKVSYNLSIQPISRDRRTLVVTVDANWRIPVIIRRKPRGEEVEILYRGIRRVGHEGRFDPSHCVIPPALSKRVRQDVRIYFLSPPR